MVQAGGCKVSQKSGGNPAGRLIAAELLPIPPVLDNPDLNRWMKDLSDYIRRLAARLGSGVGDGTVTRTIKVTSVLSPAWQYTGKVLKDEDNTESNRVTHDGRDVLIHNVFQEIKTGVKLAVGDYVTGRLVAIHQGKEIYDTDAGLAGGIDIQCCGDGCGASNSVVITGYDVAFDGSDFWKYPITTTINWCDRTASVSTGAASLVFSTTNCA